MNNAPDKHDWFPEFIAGIDLAFTHYFDLYHRDLFYISFRIVRDTETAEDIAADAFSMLWENRQKMKDEQHIRAFLITVTRNNSLNHLKHENVKAASEDELRRFTTDLDGMDITNHLIETELVKRVHKAVDRLPGKCKEVFRLIFFHHASTREVSQKLNISERNVLNQKARALELLRGILKMSIGAILNFF